jgi:hypothetical protein
MDKRYLMTIGFVVLIAPGGSQGFISTPRLHLRSTADGVGGKLLVFIVLTTPRTIDILA